jgi:hypothetical protein
MALPDISASAIRARLREPGAHDARLEPLLGDGRYGQQPPDLLRQARKQVAACACHSLNVPAHVLEGSAMLPKQP